MDYYHHVSKEGNSRNPKSGQAAEKHSDNHRAYEAPPSQHADYTDEDVVLLWCSEVPDDVGNVVRCDPYRKVGQQKESAR
jgi:hypothetical protein